MNSSSIYMIAADIVLFGHIMLVIFVVFGLLLIIVGKTRNWSWVHNRCFRIIHLACISVVVIQAWPGMVCPLTSMEMWLRSHAGEGVYVGSFVSHWMQSLLYYNAPPWVFIFAYTVFGVAVLSSWIWVPA